ncbi:hypothetical protein [Planobispora longispora]|uniref:Secreted protein n=1 Tax=Planobispora longispora TaxID=28887 RepID=A0A8J3RN96_9ACTN|nr:hypothetical protein [Planobispora longispora]BFE81375.1 hypothetical protein GCM10020093_039760 [Planobispora longispora]GIH76719.1 hypothetical protein Plo01_31480 [Planobispora longispora]
MKRLTTGLLAATATAAALTLAVPAAAQAATTPVTASTGSTSSGYDYDDYWGPVFSSNHKAKAKGWIGVEWNHHQTSNEVHVRGKLYDLDYRTYSQGGKCAYVKIQARHFEDHHGYWFKSKNYKYCGAGDYKKFHLYGEDIADVRVKVCQIGLHSSYPTRCGDWEYIYSTESE